jgi:hypothetical protein
MPMPTKPAAGGCQPSGGLTVASRACTFKRGWYWRGFGVHRSFQDLSAVCVTATESFGMSCVQSGAPAG